MGAVPVCAPSGGRTGTQVSADDQQPSPVKLHVYNCGKFPGTMAANTLLRALGTGAFHCGVEVHGREWSFQSSGVFLCKPRCCEQHDFYESLSMGETTLSEIEVFDAIRDLRWAGWDGCSYSLLEHNCCHFCDALCRRLGVGGIPSWVMTLATAGVAVRETLNAASCGQCVPLCYPSSKAFLEAEDVIASDRFVNPLRWNTRPQEVAAV
uniref:PPPDE domain-containing protein n=1 Tax=Alexandrium andersonii TaxID=327968 RepID=A0A7S2GPE4_9DINO